MDRSIIRMSFRACVAAGNRKPSRADVSSRSYLYKLTLENLYVEETLERSWRASRKRSRAQMFILTRRDLATFRVRKRVLCISNLSTIKVFTRVNISSTMIIIRKYLFAIYLQSNINIKLTAF